MDPLEIIIEPDVVPEGTVDLRSLDAPPGTLPPARWRKDVEGLLTRDVVAEARSAVREAATTASSSVLPAHRDSKATTVPPPGLFTQEVEEGEPASIAALDAAANAPMPPRPESANHSRPEATTRPAADATTVPSKPLAYLDEADTFETSLGSRARLAFEAARLTLVLLVLFGMLGGLWLYLTGTIGTSEVAQIETTTTDPTTAELTVPPVDSPEDTPPEVTIPEDSPPEVAAPEDTPPEVTAPEDTPPEDTAPEDTPTPEDAGAAASAERLEGLRAMAEKAATGAEVGVEEDAPGLIARIDGLRSEAARQLEEGGLAAAATLLRELLKLAPNDPDGLFRMGLVFQHMGKAADAEENYRRAAENDPQDARPWNNLSVIQEAQGKHEQARASLNKALALDPEDPAVLTNLANALGERSPAQAHPLYDKALSKDADHEPARLGRARVRERLGDDEGARADYLVLVEARSRLRPEAYDGLGRISGRAGKHEQSIAYHRKAFQERSKELPEAQVDLGLALVGANQYQQAVRVLTAATKADPNDQRAWQALGYANTQWSQASRPGALYEARKAYEAALRIEGSALNHFNYALCAERFGNFPVAILHYEKAIAADPKAWKSYTNLARLYERADRQERALAFLDKAVQANPSEPELHLHRAYLLGKLSGREMDARAALRRFVELAPPSDERLDQINRALSE